MTIDARALLAALSLALGCASLHENRQGDSVDVSSYPPDIQRAYEVFALRCSRCHTLARPLNARIHDPQHWIRYVARMRRQPGSGIDHNNADLILKFLLYYHRPPLDEEAPDEVPAQPSTPPQPAPEPQPRAPVPIEAPPQEQPALLPPAPPLPEQPESPDDATGTHGGVPQGGEP